MVDIRDNTPEAPSIFEMESGGMEGLTSSSSSNNNNVKSSMQFKFNPSQLLIPSGAPSKDDFPSNKNTVVSSTSEPKKKKNLKKNKSSSDIPAAIKKPSFEDSIKKIKEIAWQGRQQGLEKSIDIDTKESIRLRKNTAIPPLGQENERSPSRGHSAPHLQQITNNTTTATTMEPLFPNVTAQTEELVTAAIMKARSTKEKTKKASEVEKRLFNRSIFFVLFLKNLI